MSTIAKALPPARASRRAYQTLAYTDIIGGSWMSTKYATELLMVDPLAELEEDCLTVVGIGDSTVMARYSSTGHDANGRFCRRGAPEEMVFFGSAYLSRDEVGRDGFRLLGRVVGCDREFPRELPATYSSGPSARARQCA